MVTFAHISDIHLPLQKVTAKELFSKRVLGYLSWQRKRKNIHRLETLDALIAGMKAQKPDHICITGDLVNIATSEEIHAAAGWLEDLAPAEQISLVPGNHDAYVPSGEKRAKTRWRSWMDDGAGFPYIHRRGSCAFIGLDTAVATAPFMASGKLGKAQLQRLATVLRDTKKEGLIRVVMLHHPPQEGAEPWRKALRDARDFRAVIAREGAEIILHGHKHKPLYAEIEGPDGMKVPVYGAGSVSNCIAPHYHIFDIDENGNIQVRHCNNIVTTKNKKDE